MRFQATSCGATTEKRLAIGRVRQFEREGHGGAGRGRGAVGERNTQGFTRNSVLLGHERIRGIQHLFC